MISKSIKGTSQQIKKEKPFSITILNLPKTSNSILKFDMHKNEGFLICLIHNKEELMYTTNNTPYYQHARTSKCMDFMIIHHCCFFCSIPFLLLPHTREQQLVCLCVVLSVRCAVPAACDSYHRF